MQRNATSTPTWAGSGPRLGAGTTWRTRRSNKNERHGEHLLIPTRFERMALWTLQCGEAGITHSTAELRDRWGGAGGAGACGVRGAGLWGVASREKVASIQCVLQGLAARVVWPLGGWFGYRYLTMASSSMSGASRFSTTLKAFKFSKEKDKDKESSGGGGGSSSSSSKPPPPPPKDGYYLNSNRSFASLSPSVGPGPESPLSVSNKSATSLVPSPTEREREVPPMPGGGLLGRKKSAFFKFGRRNGKSEASASASQSTSPSASESQEDEGISMPWNFQASWKS
ncbi:hypothetical protein H0H92_006009 [Tricholoma furcatifolium]|nr:hypothetical protein H0H92_006009 [Tricholoma furcatifolium]